MTDWVYVPLPKVFKEKIDELIEEEKISFTSTSEFVRHSVRNGLKEYGIIL